MYDFDRVIDRAHTGSLKWDKYRNQDVLPLWVADMDFVSAPEIIAALQARLDHGVFGYTIPYEAVQQAVIHYLSRVHQLTVQPEWLVWMPGLVPALNVAVRAFAAPGEALLTCTPVYAPFLRAPVWQGRQLIASPLKLERGRWTFDFEDLEKRVTPETKAFILCNPHNPVGRVYSEQELLKLADFCTRHDLVICSDEIHCDLVYSGHEHIPIARLSSAIADRTITLMAPSKTYNLPGLACSFLIISNSELRARLQLAARGLITEVNSFGYAGCAAAYDQGEPWRQALMRYLAGNRDLLAQFIREQLPGISMGPMEATYLAWLNIEALNLKEPISFFEQAGVGLSNGADFGDERYVRLNFGCPRSFLLKGLERMRVALR